MSTKFQSNISKRTKSSKKAKHLSKTKVLRILEEPHVYLKSSKSVSWFQDPDLLDYNMKTFMIRTKKAKQLPSDFIKRVEDANLLAFGETDSKYTTIVVCKNDRPSIARAIISWAVCNHDPYQGVIQVPSADWFVAPEMSLENPLQPNHEPFVKLIYAMVDAAKQQIVSTFKDQLPYSEPKDALSWATAAILDALIACCEIDTYQVYLPQEFCIPLISKICKDIIEVITILLPAYIV